MSSQMVVVLGLAVWGGVFVCLLVAMAIEADVERRWDESWALSWEQGHGGSIDPLLERLAKQEERWRGANRLCTLYLVLGVAALAVVAFFQYRSGILDAVPFRDAMLFGLGLVGLLLLPLRVVCEIGLGLVETMHRQLRNAVGERILIEAKQELTQLPKPKKEKKKAEEPEPAQK